MTNETTADHGEDALCGQLTVGSLFSGIGGIDLGLERAGMRVVWQSEIQPYACQVLSRHWPEVPNLGDVKLIEWNEVEHVDVICGGYPCQPFSSAGRRQGRDDPRHLWPFVADAVRHLRPRFVLMENVAGHLSLGFGAVLGDLAALGYDAEWECVPAASVGAPHIRDRVFIVAYPSRGSDQDEPQGDRAGQSLGTVAGSGDRATGGHPASGTHVARRCASVVAADVADTDCPRLPILQGGDAGAELAGLRASGGRGWWSVEPAVGRVADGVPSRVDRVRGLGNAVVPQVAEWIGHRLIAACGRTAVAA